MYLWDSNVLRHHSQGHALVEAHLKRVPRNEVALPTIVVAEVLRGRCEYLLKATVDKVEFAQQLLLDELQRLHSYQIVPINQSSRVVLAQLLKNHPGRKRHADIIIAAIALAGGHIVVTRNQKDFADLLPKHQLQNWIDDPPIHTTF